ARRGGPRIYVSHGTQDNILPIDQCSRRIVPMLRQAGYDVRYDEFDGGHTAPPAITSAAVEWLLAWAPGSRPPGLREDEQDAQDTRSIDVILKYPVSRTRPGCVQRAATIGDSPRTAIRSSGLPA